ncbi:MAG: LamG-like jellyroll fold domain-containing protein [Nanoarchaeota archaeon]
MGFGSLVGQAIFYVTFLAIIVISIGLYSRQNAMTNEAIDIRSDKLLDVANAKIKFLSATYETGHLNVRLENEGSTVFKPEYANVYVDGARLNRTVTNLTWVACDAVESSTRCGNIGHGDYSWESTDLVGLWHFDESAWTGATREVIDSSSDANHGSILGSDNTTEDAKLIRAADIDSGISLPAANYSGRYNFTISLWFKTAGNDASSTYLYREALDLAAGSVAIAFNIDNTLRASVIAENLPDLMSMECNTARTYNDSQWHHLVFMRSAPDRISLYIDGQQDCIFTDDTAGNYLYAGSSQTFIGTSDGIDAIFNGTVDEVAIWSQPMPESQIVNLYRKAKQTTNPTLWDPLEYLEADLPYTLSSGTHRIDFVTDNGIKTTRMVTVP